MSNLSDKLKEMRERCEAATKGPMVLVRHDWEGGDINYQIECKDITAKHLVVASVMNKLSDAKFVSNSFTDMPALLDAIEMCLGALQECCYCDEGWYRSIEPCVSCEATTKVEAILLKAGK